MVYKLKELVARIDGAPCVLTFFVCVMANVLHGFLTEELHLHMEKEGLQFIQFAFRWMNCLLMRELSLGLIIRLWDACVLSFDLEIILTFNFVVVFPDIWQRMKGMGSKCSMYTCVQPSC